MLGNSQHLYPGAEEEEEEEEEEEDEDGEENGELDGEEEDEEEEAEVSTRRGSGQYHGGREEGHRQIGNMAGRLTGDRQMRPGNPGHAANPYSSNPGPTHQQTANQQQQQQQRRTRERSSSTAPPADDAHISMMVFRIGIPDIKQTVSLTHTHTRTHTHTLSLSFTHTLARKLTHYFNTLKRKCLCNPLDFVRAHRHTCKKI